MDFSSDGEKETNKEDMLDKDKIVDTDDTP